MDSQNSNDSGSNKTEESPPEKILSSGIQLRASARVLKKLRLDQEQALAQLPSPEKKGEPSASNGIVTEEKRRRRAPVLWSADDKAAFFEALNEHGKNFDAIEKYMISRAKKRGDGAAKNREKARYFYYRAWHKLSRYVQFPTSVKKVTQELYALINFGELRKKVGHITEKNAQKLNELIYCGRTQVRVRGKTWRIKTPVCRALRRLNNLDEDCEEVRLPARVDVLLSPRTNRDSIAARVAGHNPRAKAVLSLDTNLNSVISFLKSRWSSPIQRGELRVGPKTDAVITQPQYKCGQAVTSSSVSLLAHEQRCGGDVAEVQALLDQLHAGKTKGTLKKEKEGPSLAEDVANTDFMDPLVAESASVPLETPSAEEKEVVDKEEFSVRAREGWTEDSSIKTKIGQLYMMLGSKGVLELEYWWTYDENQKELTKALHRLVSLARLYHFKAKVECPCGHKCKNVSKPGTSDAGKALKRPPATNHKKSQFSVDIPSVSNQKSDVPSRSMDDGMGGFTTDLNQLVSGTFKHPLLPAPMKKHNSSSTIDTLKQLQTFRPKYCNRRGRSRSRAVVVQRMLPLLPKSSQNQPLMVTVITPASTQTVSPQVGDAKEERISMKDESVAPVANLPSLLIQEEMVVIGNNGHVVSHEEEVNSTAVITNEPPPEDILSTNTFKGGTEEKGVSLKDESLLRMANLPSHLSKEEMLVIENNDHILSHEKEVNSTVVIATEIPSEDALSTNTFKGILGGTAEGDLGDDTPPSSPSRILKEGEGQWLTSEVTDFSLSSFLGHLESPLKPNGTTVGDDIHISTDVESHFQSLMTESSLDYTAKFADLAEKIAGGAGPHTS